jgi:ribosomal protein S15P/S13E
MTEIAVAMTTEIEPPPEGKKPRKPRKKTNGQPVRTRTGIPRPYRTLQADVLTVRISKLTTRLEKAKKQHETTRQLLTKYAHESYYREKEVLDAAQPDVALHCPIPPLRNDIEPPAIV